MEIESVDGNFTEALSIRNCVRKLTLSHRSTKSFISISPYNLLEKWKVPKVGFYAPIDVRFVVTPHVSEKAGLTAVVTLIDLRDTSPSRVLYRSRKFNLGSGLEVEGSQLPFCLPVGNYPLQFEVTVSRSQFLEGSTLFTTSLEWRMLYSTIEMPRITCVFGAATRPALKVEPSFAMKVESSKGKSGRSRKSKVNGPEIRCHSPVSVGGSSDTMPQSSHAWEEGNNSQEDPMDFSYDHHDLS